MKKLSQSTIEKLGHYVYLLVDPRTNKPFYVGKGSGSRINNHLFDALKVQRNEKDKIRTIKEILNSGKEVRLLVLRHGLTKEEAFEVESAVIDFIGKENLTNIVLGHHSLDRGLMSLEDIKIKFEAENVKFKEPVILINIERWYNSKISKNELYEATRKYWKVNRNRANRIRIACAVFRGIIREVYLVNKWKPDPKWKTGSKEKKRYFFTGDEAPSKIRNKYLNKSVKKYWKQGAQNPIKYAGPNSKN